MAVAFEIAVPDLGPLHRALAECGIDGAEIPEVARRLIRPPLTLRPDPTRLRGFDGDIAARLLRLDENCPDPQAKWKALSRAERKQAKRLWDWLGRDHGLSATPKGRPPKIDAVLVLYCIQSLCEATRQPHFKFSRPAGGGAPGGPMWRALNEALPIAQQFLALRFWTPIPNCDAEAIAEIAKLTRSKRFEKWCQRLWLGAKSDDVACSAAVFRLAVTYARKSRPRRRRR
jgi:hypothetical protein